MAGMWNWAGRSYGCILWNRSRKTHGYVDLRKALAVSCNYYFYDIASGEDLASGTSLGYEQKMDNERILSYAKRMGLGLNTGIELPESKGILPSEKRKEKQLQQNLKQYLLEERETFFKEEFCRNDAKLDDLIEKIVNWS